MAPPADARREPLVTRFERACWVLALVIVVAAAVAVGAAVMRASATRAARPVRKISL